jgi:hypothetical protein
LVTTPEPPLLPEASIVVSSPLAGEIDSARVCRVDSELEWQPHAAIAVHSGATKSSLGIRATCAAIDEQRGMGPGAWDGPSIPRPRPLTPDSGCSARGGHTRTVKIGIDRSGPVSRVLSRAVISLGRRLPAASSNLPGSFCEPDKLATVARSSPCVVLLQVGFAEQPVTRTAGALLPHRFTLTTRSWPTNQPRPRGGLLSVALSLSSRTVGVTHHPVLWSPDFPLRNRLIPKDHTVSQRPLGPLRPEHSLYRLLVPGSLTHLVRFLFYVGNFMIESL